MNQMFRPRKLHVLAGSLLVLPLVYAVGATAQDRTVHSSAEPMVLSVGRSVVIDRSTSVARISISNPDVVDAVAVTSREILINAKSPGLSSLVIWSKAGDRVCMP